MRVLRSHSNGFESVSLVLVRFEIVAHLVAAKVRSSPMILSRPAPTLSAEPNGAQINALKRGDDDAWTAAFRQLWPVALRAGQHPELRLSPWEAEEVASEALASLVSRIENVATLDELSALAATIAYRRAVSVARRKFAAKRQPAAGTSDLHPDGEDLDTLASEIAESRLTDVELGELTLLLSDALSDLDEDVRQLIQEKLVMGMSYEELSAKHKIPLGTACAKVARGLKKVRQRLDESPALMKELRDYLR